MASQQLKRELTGDVSNGVGAAMCSSDRAERQNVHMRRVIFGGAIVASKHDQDWPRYAHDRAPIAQGAGPTLGADLPVLLLIGT